MLTKVEIVSTDNIITSLSVAPLAVLPEFQRQGIGGMLIREAHKIAASLGYGSAVLLGHKDYYPRFGYQKAINFGIGFPFDVPHDFCFLYLWPWVDRRQTYMEEREQKRRFSYSFWPFFVYGMFCGKLVWRTYHSVVYKFVLNRILRLLRGVFGR